MYLLTLQDEERSHLNIDDILALYLVDISEIVIVNFYKAVVVFIQLYRNCLNEIGWDKLGNYKRLDTGKDVLPEYTSVKDAESIPEISNEFLVRYLPMKCISFDRQLAL